MRTASLLTALIALALAGCSGGSSTPSDSAAASSAASGSEAGSGSESGSGSGSGNGGQLADAVGKVVAVNGSAADVTCPDFKSQEGANIGFSGDSVVCQATITPAGGAEYKTSIRVTWDDDEGHFTTAEEQTD